MHENREISSSPLSDDQGRSAKATSYPQTSFETITPTERPYWASRL